MTNVKQGRINVNKRRVLIVRAGGWDKVSAEAGDYDPLIEMIKAQVREITKNVPAMPVEVVVAGNIDEADKIMFADFYAVIFLTRSMMAKAREMKAIFRQRHRNTKVIVLTGLMPEEDVIIVHKDWLTYDLINSILRCG